MLRAGFLAIIKLAGVKFTVVGAPKKVKPSHVSELKKKTVTAASVSVNFFFFNAPMMKLLLQLDSNRPGLPFLAGRV